MVSAGWTRSGSRSCRRRRSRSTRRPGEDGPVELLHKQQPGAPGRRRDLVRLDRADRGQDGGRVGEGLSRRMGECHRRALLRGADLGVRVPGGRGSGGHGHREPSTNEGLGAAGRAVVDLEATRSGVVDVVAYFTGAAWLVVIGGLVGAPPLLALGIANFVKGRRRSANTSAS